MDSIEKTIERVLNNPKMISEILDAVIDELKKTPRIKVDDLIMDKFSIVLQYYLITRDSNTNYSFSDIYYEYFVLLNTNLNRFPNLKDNILKNGFLTSTFNGHDREYIEKYGFDYFSLVDSREEEEINKGFNSLKNLENELGKNDYYFGGHDGDINTIYLSTPGFSTIQYALSKSPERLYNGPLKDNNTKMIVGESKEDYIRRSLIERLGSNKDRYLEDVLNVSSIYCTKKPCISFIKISDINDIPISDAYYDKSYCMPLEKFINKFNISYLDDFFSKSIFIPGNGNLFNQVRFNDMVSLAGMIPRESISIISVPDLYDLKQTLALMMGYNIGDYFEPNIRALDSNKVI